MNVFLQQCNFPEFTRFVLFSVLVWARGSVARRAFGKAGMVTHRVCAPVGVIQSGITFGTGSLNCLKPLRLDELHQPALG